MNTKTKGTTSFFVVYFGSIELLFVAIIVTVVWARQDRDKAYQQYKAQNDCPYELQECPNAQAIITGDSIAYSNAEYIDDSLIDRTTAREAQLAGCEFQDHSRITELVAY